MRDRAETSSVSTSTVMYVIKVISEKINRVISEKINRVIREKSEFLCD